MWKQLKYKNEDLNYEANEDGQVRNIKTKRILKPIKRKTGYLEYNLYLKDKTSIFITAHRLLALNFLDNPNNLPTVNHLDGNKENNNISNLEWSTYSNNEKHAWDNNLNVPHITRAVIQYDIHWNVIAEYNSIIDAVNATGATKIREVANGNRKTSGGFRWGWKEDFVCEDRGKSKKVSQYDLNNNFLKEFESVSVASRMTGANRNGISSCCLGHQKSCGGFKWQFS